MHMCACHRRHEMIHSCNGRKFLLFGLRFAMSRIWKEYTSVGTFFCVLCGRFSPVFNWRTARRQKPFIVHSCRLTNTELIHQFNIVPAFAPRSQPHQSSHRSGQSIHAKSKSIPFPYVTHHPTVSGPVPARSSCIRLSIVTAKKKIIQAHPFVFKAYPPLCAWTASLWSYEIFSHGAGCRSMGLVNEEKSTLPQDWKEHTRAIRKYLMWLSNNPVLNYITAPTQAFLCPSSIHVNILQQSSLTPRLLVRHPILLYMKSCQGSPGRTNNDAFVITNASLSSREVSLRSRTQVYSS